MMVRVTCVFITLFGVTAERGGYIDAVAEGVKRPSTTIFDPGFPSGTSAQCPVQAVAEAPSSGQPPLPAPGGFERA